MAHSNAKRPDREADANKTPEASPMTGGPHDESVHSRTTKRKDAGSDAKLASLEQKLADADSNVGQLKETLLRTAAEYENFRKRSQKETAAAFSDGVSYAAVELLPVLDTLDAAANAPTTDEEYKKGVLLTLSKCEEVFKKLGICELEALGKPFDPELHNAVMQQPAEGAASGTVTQVMQKGYALGDKVIRHSMVAVAP